jgi:hypothetical protein
VNPGYPLNCIFKVVPVLHWSTDHSTVLVSSKFLLVGLCVVCNIQHLLETTVYGESNLLLVQQRDVKPKDGHESREETPVMHRQNKRMNVARGSLEEHRGSIE